MEFRKVLCNEILKLMEEDKKVVVLDADLGAPNGLGPVFEKYPERCFQVGIAESNMASIAAGLSAYGYKPIVVTFAPFATRRMYDQIAVSIAYAKQNVKIIGTDPGISAELNGGTHMTFEDISLMRSLPNFVVFDAADSVQFSALLPGLLREYGNVYIRTPRKLRPDVFEEGTIFAPYQASILKEGKDVTIITTGTLLYEAKLAFEVLKEKGISVEIINANYIKPLDKETILKSIRKTNCAVVCENHNLIGGLYSAVSELICSSYPVPVLGVGVNDQFGQVGTYDDLLKCYNLTSLDIVKQVEKIMKIKK